MEKRTLKQMCHHDSTYSLNRDTWKISRERLIPDFYQEKVKGKKGMEWQHNFLKFERMNISTDNICAGFQYDSYTYIYVSICFFWLRKK